VFGFFGWILFRLSGDVALRVTKKSSSFHVVCEEGIGSLCDRIVCRVTRLQRMFICTVALPMGRRHMVLISYVFPHLLSTVSLPLLPHVLL
jgi:hypothetical protein